MKVDLTCPIELWAYELPTKDAPYCSFTFFNLGERTISSIQITVTCFDSGDEVLSRRIERPMALDARGRSSFSVTLSTQGMAVESIDLIIDKAWFDDGSDWRRAQEARLTDYQPNELPPNRKLEQLRYVAGNDAVGYPSDQRHVWICVCGRVNAAEEKACKRCQRDKKEVFARYSAGAIQQTIDQRERELEEKARVAREEASRQEFLRQEKLRRKRRNRRARTIALCTLITVGAVGYLFVVLALPELKYQSAKAALASGSYGDARTAFESLSDYRDSEEMLLECDLKVAESFLKSGTEDKIDQSLAMLEELGDYPGADELVDEANYQKASALMARSEYQQASELLAALPDYRDANTLYQKAEYEAAKAQMAAGQYEQAGERFAALGMYLDAAVQARECVYRPATKRMADGDYDNAAALFESIPGYRDANVLRLECVYQSALKAQRNGNYDLAAERFMELGGYEDAGVQVKESIYLAAKAAFDAGEYVRAAGLYGTFPSYKDSAEMQRVSLYTPAVELMNDKEYDEAADLFRRIRGYKDAQDLFNQCLYLPALDAITAGNFDKAIELLSQISNYKDAAKKLSEAQYKQAEQLEEAGDFDAAIDAFAALDDYSDAADRVMGAQYNKAELAFSEQRFVEARDAFAALEGFSDAAERVLECEYQVILQGLTHEDLVQNDNLEEVYDALLAMEGYKPAAEKATEVIYTIGRQRANAGDMEAAAEAFATAKGYLDADERRMDCIYEQADQLMLDGEFQQAAGLFDSIATYTNARVRRDEAYDMWLMSKAAKAADLYQMEQYLSVVEALEGLDINALPRAYANLKNIYLESNIKVARQLIEDSKSLDAYKYLVNCDGYKNSSQLLEKNIYAILGTWETELGAVYAFYFNGTCNINGTTLYFNMLDPYGIQTGESEGSLSRQFSFANSTKTTLTIREDATGKTIRLMRIKEAEEAPTEETGNPGRPVVVSVTSNDDGAADAPTDGADSPSDADPTPADDDAGTSDTGSAPASLPNAEPYPSPAPSANAGG